MNLNRILRFVREDECGNLYILKSDIDKFNLSLDELKILNARLDTDNISIKDIVTRNNRSTLVPEYNYKLMESYDSSYFDKSAYAIIEMDENGDIYEIDYSKLNQRIDNLIDSLLFMKKKRNKITGEWEYYPSLQFNSLLTLKLSEVEQDYAMKYLEEKGIRVCGYNETMSNQYSNYDYFGNYKYDKFKEFLTDSEVREKIISYKTTTDLELKKKLREEIILNFLYLIKSVYVVNKKFHDFDFYELETYGYEGLMLALENFDYNRGVKFKTLAVEYIIYYFKRGKCKILLGKLNEFTQEFISAMYQVEKNTGKNLKESPEILSQIIEVMLMIDADINNEEKRKLLEQRINLLFPETTDELEILYDDLELETVENDIDNSILRRFILESLKNLSERDKIIVSKYFGLDGKNYRVLEIGKEFNISRKRIYKIKDEAISKIRRSRQYKILKELYYSDSVMKK